MAKLFYAENESDTSFYESVQDMLDDGKWEVGDEYAVFKLVFLDNFFTQVEIFFSRMATVTKEDLK